MSVRNRFYQISLFFIIVINVLSFNSASAQMDSLHVFFIGNSVTENLKPEGFDGIVRSSDKHITWGWNVIYGQALSYIWEHSGDGFIETPYDGFENALANYQWDALTLQPYQRKINGNDGDLASVLKFLELAKVESPDIQIYIYQRWPRLPAGVKPTAQTWDSLWLRRYDQETSIRYDSRDFFETLTDSVRANQSGTKKCLMIPVGEVMYRLNQEMKNGNMPGYSNIWQVYNDDIHMKGIGSYIIAATYYATLYQSDPRGISAPGLYGWFNPEQKNLIQQIVFDVIMDYKDSQGANWSGVNEITGLPEIFDTEGFVNLFVRDGVLSVSFAAPFGETRKTVKLFALNGQLIDYQEASDEAVFNIQVPAGIYILRIDDLTGQTPFPALKVFID
jgi:hypothetical protein